LGAAFAMRARAAGHAVATIDLQGEVDRRCDIGDPMAVADAVHALAPEAVVHLAAILTDTSAADPVAATRVNALGTAAVFDAAAKVRAGKVVYASSIAAVGISHDGSGDAVALAPRSVYGATKAFGEHLARALSDVPDGPGYVMLRFGWVYGPGRERGWRVAQEIVESFARGDRQIRFPDFPGSMDWTYVDDAVEVLLRAVVRPLPRYSAFNVVGDKRSMRDAVAHLRRRFPEATVEAVPASTPPSAWGLRNDGLKAALGFEPSIRLEAGIDRMLAAEPPKRRGA